MTEISDEWIACTWEALKAGSSSPHDMAKALATIRTLKAQLEAERAKQKAWAKAALDDSPYRKKPRAPIIPPPPANTGESDAD